MCGIAGIVDPNPQDPQALRALIERMTQAIAHRGPDGDGHFADTQAALGHRRLAILDLSDAAAQPMYAPEQGLVLVFNGEIYNFVELRQELRALGHSFSSSGDSEVLLRAYQQWGPACVARFNGMWAFAVWDARRRELFLSRDRLGVKPLFFAERAGRLHFASEVAGLRAVLDLREANAAKLHDYLAFGYRTNDGDTFFAGVHELPPGCNVLWRDGRLTQSRHWSLPLERRPMSADEASDRLRELLADSVRLRFRSDVPVALLQSGGIDSSILASIVNDAIDTGALPPSDVTAYSAIFPGHKLDESAAIRALLATCPHIKLVTLTPDASHVAKDFSAYCAAMQEPMGGAASFVHWKLMQQVRAAGTKVVINGQGADEAWAGYGYYVRGYRLLDLALTQPLRALGELHSMQREMGLGLGSTLAQTAKAALGRRTASRVRSRFKEGTWGVLAPSFRATHADHLPDLGMVWGAGNLDRHLRAQVSDYGFNQILHYEDQSAMSQGIEIRSPFVDYRLMELAFSLPDDLKFSDGHTKRLLRQSYARRIPAQIIGAGRKIGFGTPVAEWMADPAMQSLVSELTSHSDFRQRSLWNADAVAAKLRDPAQAQAGFPVWRFLMVAQWLRQNQIGNV